MAEGKETIDGVATVKISGTVDAAIVDPIVPSMGEGGGQLPITFDRRRAASGGNPGELAAFRGAVPGTGPTSSAPSSRKIKARLT